MKTEDIVKNALFDSIQEDAERIKTGAAELRAYLDAIESVQPGTIFEARDGAFDSVQLQLLIAGLERFRDDRIRPASTLLAFLQNDLVGFLDSASDETLRLLPLLRSWTRNNLPVYCWRSPEAVKSWLADETPLEAAVRSDITSADCPQCNDNARTSAEVVEVFGLQLAEGSWSVQPRCRECRGNA